MKRSMVAAVAAASLTMLGWGTGWAQTKKAHGEGQEIEQNDTAAKSKIESRGAAFGVIKSMNPEEQELVVKDRWSGEVARFHVTDDTKITRGGKFDEISRHDLKVGDRIHYELKGDEARRIHVNIYIAKKTPSAPLRRRVEPQANPQKDPVEIAEEQDAVTQEEPTMGSREESPATAGEEAAGDEPGLSPGNAEERGASADEDPSLAPESPSMDLEEGADSVEEAGPDAGEAADEAAYPAEGGETEND